ncbi:hypothetical protein OTK49_00845 [Vibrio coralliirubri]|uniref:hypothetical protein n=1 Tax=Vibrio coralliirubri TaxID=1516159 RepID=UPI002283C0A2|nr:hypothetical protein [Vibrio coralliirubri]MCY9861078.1 hypothetical protein [Vibrio coralliirubri]
MQLKKISLVVLASLASGAAFASTATATVVEAPEPNLYDEVMAKSVGQYKVGQRELNYTVSGQLNYVYGFNDLESGIQNSNLNLSTSSSLAYGVDAIVSAGVRETYDVSTNEFDTKFDGALKLTKDSHEFKIGYDKHVANRVLGGKIKMNADTSLTKNAIGQQLSHYDGYGEYSYSFQNYSLIGAVDFDGNLYGGLSAYANGTDVKLHLFEGYNNDINAFFDVGTMLGQSVKTSVGLGFINDKISFMADASYFVTDALTVYGNVLGDEDYSSATLGAEYAYGSLAAYVEGIVELTDPRVNGDSVDGVMVGAKFMF